MQHTIINLKEEISIDIWKIRNKANTPKKFQYKTIKCLSLHIISTQSITDETAVRNQTESETEISSQQRKSYLLHESSRLKCAL